MATVAKAHLIYSVKHIVIKGQGYSGLIYRVCSVQFISQGVFALKTCTPCISYRKVKRKQLRMRETQTRKKYKMSSHKHSLLLAKNCNSLEKLGKNILFVTTRH